MKNQERNTDSPPHQTQQRALEFLKALQHYKETVSITTSDDTHGPK